MLGAMRLLLLGLANCLIVVGIGGAVISQTGQTAEFLDRLDRVGLSGVVDAIPVGADACWVCSWLRARRALARAIAMRPGERIHRVFGPADCWTRCAVPLGDP